MISVPIHVNGDFMGTVFGDGFIDAETAAEQKAIIRSYLERDFPSQPELIQQIEDLPVLSEKKNDTLLADHPCC